MDSGYIMTPEDRRNNAYAKEFAYASTGADRIRILSESMGLSNQELKERVERLRILSSVQ